ncbi:hypothetical protein [Oceanobacter mangrovi]|uniref:hypothetical protein n=1 Tax=Oceanobacter mangrovi TaxID=2862510 RepID=UPI001C8D78E2|nr:hypothetical protein [Oceanobacter mangrovi]
MSLLDTNLDELIQNERAKLEELLRLKEQQQQKIDALQSITSEFDAGLKKHGISANEYFGFIAGNLEQWIKGAENLPIYDSLAKHFSKVAAKAAAAAAANPVAEPAEKVSTLPKPKLKVGSYRNPATNEVVEKIKRNPKQLDQWVEDYGFAVVRTWKM